MATTLVPGDRVTYLIGGHCDTAKTGTVTRTGWELSGDWAEVLRDEFPEGPAARLSVRGSQVEKF